MTYLTREAILDAQDLPTETVEVPEWGGAVLVRGLTGRERDAFEASMIEQKGRKTTFTMSNFRAKLAARTIIDENGKRMFSDKDMDALGGKSAVALQRVFNVAQQLSGLSDADVEELTKN